MNRVLAASVPGKEEEHFGILREVLDRELAR